MTETIKLNVKIFGIVLAASITLAIAASGWAWGLATERGEALSRLNEVDRRLATVETQIDLLRMMNNRIGRIETDIQWIKRSLTGEKQQDEN